ncbi:MAG TPA: O-antigen polymerase [Cyclobacteriaceae bacterium]|nr:O-antigen polymerase [Cyclobacteriaceae bacterium]
MQDRGFTIEEAIPFYGILITIITVLLFSYFKNRREFWSPLTIISIIYAYYCCLGPYHAVTTNETYDRLINMRRFYESSLWGAWVSLIAYIVGFWLHGYAKRTRLLPDFSMELVSRYGKRMFIVGFTLFAISTGGNFAKMINPLDAQYVEQVGGGFANYLGLSLNMVIPAITMLFLYFVTTRRGFLWFAIPFIVCLGIFITLGFRYRLVLLLASMVIVYYYAMGRRPNVIFISLAVFVFISLMGIINISRQYNVGLNVSKLDDEDSEGYYASGLREAYIFQTSGAIIDIVPERHPHAGFQPIWSTIVFPIPRAFYPEKNSAEYLFSALDAIYGKTVSQGAAIMAYGEYYLAFGWAGIVIGCGLIGWVYRKLWNWYLANSSNAFVMTAYAVTVSYLYVIISRGYLPQVVNLFFFSVFPIYVALRFARKYYFPNFRPVR